MQFGQSKHLLALSVLFMVTSLFGLGGCQQLFQKTSSAPIQAPASRPIKGLLKAATAVTLVEASAQVLKRHQGGTAGLDELFELREAMIIHGTQHLEGWPALESEQSIVMADLTLSSEMESAAIEPMRVFTPTLPSPRPPSLNAIAERSKEDAEGLSTPPPLLASAALSLGEGASGLVTPTLPVLSPSHASSSTHDTDRSLIKVLPLPKVEEQGLPLVSASATPSTSGQILDITPLEQSLSAGAVRSLGRLTARLDQLEARQKEVAQKAPPRSTPKTKKAPKPRFWTIRMPVKTPRVTSPFGIRRDPVQRRRRKMHRGVDFGGAKGDPVLSTGPGRVLLAGWGGRGTGNAVVIRHPGGWVSQYFHLSKVNVRAGADVKSGQKIGEIGATGRATGPHLHFQLSHVGEALNPMPRIGKKIPIPGAK